MASKLHIAVQGIRAERADDFERFLRETVQPAVQAQRPEVAGRWRAMRADGPADGIVTYVFLFEGGSLTDDWDLGPILSAHYGAEQSERLAGEWTETFAPIQQWADAAAAAGEPDDQVVWTMDEVPLT